MQPGGSDQPSARPNLCTYSPQVELIFRSQHLDTDQASLNLTIQVSIYDTMGPFNNPPTDLERWTDAVSEAEQQPEWDHSPPTSHPHIHNGHDNQNEKSGEKESEDLKTLTLLPLNGVLRQPTGQFVINIIVQVAAVAAAIAFGIFAIKSVKIANRANELAAEANRIAVQANAYASDSIAQAWMANQLTLLALCLSTDVDVRLPIESYGKYVAANGFLRST